VVDAPQLRLVVVAGGVSGSIGVLRDGQVSVLENSTVNMTCEVDAIPSPSTSALNWYRNGSLVYTGQYYVISAVQRRAAGQYQCQTSNTMTPSQHNSQTGVGHSAFNLVVMCKKSPLYFITHPNTHAQTHGAADHEQAAYPCC